MRLLRSLLLLVAAGCATSRSDLPATPTTESTTTFEGSEGAYAIVQRSSAGASSDSVFVSVDSVWVALPEIYGRLRVPVNTTDRQQRRFGAERIAVRGQLGGVMLSRLVDCGQSVMGSDNANTYSVTLSIITRLLPAGPNATVVQTQVLGKARPSGQSTGVVSCTSKGVIEERIARMLGVTR